MAIGTAAILVGWVIAVNLVPPSARSFSGTRRREPYRLPAKKLQARPKSAVRG